MDWAAVVNWSVVALLTGFVFLMARKQWRRRN